MKIDGREIAGEILKELQKKVENLKKRNIFPHLAIILVGTDPASKAYVKQKILKGETVGIKTTLYNLDSGIKNAELLEKIGILNKNPEIHGIIVQQPLPSHIDIKAITLAVNPKKDIDGFNPKSEFQSPISLAAMKILQEIYMRGVTKLEGFPTARIEDEVAGALAGGKVSAGPRRAFEDWLKSKKIVVIGKGETGGKPIINALQQLEVKPLIVDSKTIDHELLTKNADIIISAVGQENIINSKMIKKGVILVSVGLHKGNDGKLHGDYEEKDIENIASFYTPSPGGIGPINVAMLLKNLIGATKNSIDK
ncbi:MAG: bifunctional 5,10-methylenetetrahydrofolate dehydrogenase/5,10-methenyltetrahydrofolate cyclohydrolase [Candidatus Levybacteria bacterium]|nr:bifunctional 5,10-methylenetetrahydrofolate dehydrogenase/5,10-methenyltetrahydrofolate cyclohydrolase [Candidatus Levybacteria bacterium]